jgi:hypothetical protein
MSELRTEARAPSFFDLYSNGEVSPEDIDDFVDRWHDDREPWARDLGLHEYLGMTHEEYEVWLCDPFGLPSVLQARRSGRTLVDVMTERYEAMRAANRRADATILFSLGNWLKQRPSQ